MVAIVVTLSLNAQSWRTPPERPGPREWYFTSGGEWQFSYPILEPVSSLGVTDPGAGVVRFAPVFNGRVLAQYDPGAHFGFFMGMGFRNLGFIHQLPGDSVRMKYRTYNLGVPIGIKVGRMHKTLVAIGYELELPFNYKEKRFVNERKDDKFNVWFSERTERLFHSVMIAFQGPAATTLMVRYYFTNFHNRAFRRSDNGVVTEPYAGFTSNITTVSLGWGLFAGRKPDPNRRMPWAAPVDEPRARR